MLNTLFVSETQSVEFERLTRNRNAGMEATKEEQTHSVQLQAGVFSPCQFCNTCCSTANTEHKTDGSNEIWQ